MGGRGSKSGLQSTAASGGGSGGIGPTIQISVQPPQIQATQQQAQQANNAAFSDTDNAPFHDLFGGSQYYQRQNLTIDQISATIQYLRNDTEPGSQYSMSQNMNTLMQRNADTGRAITDGMNANQAFTYRHLMGAMHNLGYNINLTRYDHGDFVNKLLAQSGARSTDFTRMSITQLQNALVGKTYGENRFLSTSYNNFKNAPQGTRNTFVNRAVRIEYKAKASTQAMMPGRGPGGDAGEILLAPSGSRQNYRITGVRVDPSVKVRQKGTSWLSNQNQIVITVETD